MHAFPSWKALRPQPRDGVRMGAKAERRPGALVLIGGGGGPAGEARVLREFVRLSGGARAKIVVATVATEHPDEIGAEYLAVFRRLGCKDPHRLDVPDREAASCPETAETLEGATG